MRDILEGKKGIYVDPQHFPQEYDEALDDEDMDNEILNDLGIQNYDSVEKVLNQPEMTAKNRKYLNEIINDAKLSRNQLKRYKSHITNN